jgi:sphinganine-1-phosphate aldolase
VDRACTLPQVLYRTHELRTYQFTCVTEWTGGLYASPSQPGSRSGSLIAQTWAALVSVGMDGYMAATKELMAASQKLQVQHAATSPSPASARHRN